MKVKSPLLKESKLSNTPKQLMPNSQSFIQKNTSADSQRKKKSFEKPSFVGKSLEKTQKSPKSTTDFSYKKGENMKCITTPSSCSKTYQRSQQQNSQNSQNSSKNSKTNMINFILTNIGGKENTPQQAAKYCCMVHSNKKAKYFMEEEGKSIKLCSKCSIEKARQGYKLQEIQDASKTQIKKISLLTYQQKNPEQSFQSLECELKDAERVKKKEELDGFKLTLCELIEQLNKKQKDNEITQLEIVFNKLFESLLQVKNQLNEELANQQTERNYLYQGMLESIMKMNQDILDNEQNILDTMELKPFKEIMDLYYEKIQQHKENIAQIGNNHCQEEFQQLISQISSQFGKRAMEIMRPIDKKVFVSFQNGEIFQEALKNSKQRMNIQKVNSIPLIHEGQVRGDSNEMQDGEQFPNNKFQDLLQKINQRQSQTQQFLNYQQTLFDTDSPHFKN